MADFGRPASYRLQFVSVEGFGGRYRARTCDLLRVKQIGLSGVAQKQKPERNVSSYQL